MSDNTAMNHAVDTIRKIDGSAWSADDGIEWVHRNDIRLDDNDRHDDSDSYTRAALEELAYNICDGLQTPPTVRKPVAGKYGLTMGYRRFRAMTEVLECEYIPVYVRNLDDQKASDAMLAENTNRRQLAAMELSHAVNNRIENGQTVDRLAKITGMKESYLDRIKGLVDLIPEFQGRIVEFDREAAESGDAKQFTQQHAIELLQKHRHDADMQRVCLEIWQSESRAPTIHRWRDILKDPVAYLEKKQAGQSTVFTGPDAITGIEPTASGTPALMLNKAHKISTFFEENITALRADAGLRMGEVAGNDKMQALRDSEFWPLVQELLRANQAAVAAETLANVYNVTVSSKWVRLTGTEAMPHQHPNIKAGKAQRTYTTDQPKESKPAKSTDKGKGEDKPAKK